MLLSHVIFTFGEEGIIIILYVCCPQFTDMENEPQRRQSTLPKAT